MRLLHSFTTSTPYRRATYLLWKVTGERDGLNTAEQGVENKEICCRSFVSARGPEQAGSQMAKANGLLRAPDHIQELWHSEAIRAVIFYRATGLLYVWAKFLIYSGKTFYHRTTVEFIHHRKYHHVALYYNLYSILHPEYSTQLILRLNIADQEKVYESYKAV